MDAMVLIAWPCIWSCQSLWGRFFLRSVAGVLRVSECTVVVDARKESWVPRRMKAIIYVQQSNGATAASHLIAKPEYVLAKAKLLEKTKVLMTKQQFVALHSLMTRLHNCNDNTRLIWTKLVQCGPEPTQLPHAFDYPPVAVAASKHIYPPVPICWQWTQSHCWCFEYLKSVLRLVNSFYQLDSLSKRQWDSEAKQWESIWEWLEENVSPWSTQLWRPRWAIPCISDADGTRSNQIVTREHENKLSKYTWFSRWIFRVASSTSCEDDT